MKLSIETDRKINRLIPKLLKENKNYSKEIKTRIKIDSIFNEFEKKAKNEFNFYINDSNKRYTKAKNGQNLDNFIDESLPQYEDRLKKIMNDNFYTELNLKPEKEKMKHKSTKKIYSSIKGLISNIRTTMGISKLKKNILNNKHNNVLKNSSQKRIHRYYKYNKCYTENELSLNKKTIDDKILFMNKNKNDIKNIFNLESVRISNSIGKYKLNLSKIKIPILKDLNDENAENKKLNINLPRIKMIYYHKSNQKMKIKDDNVEKIDIGKLLPFSKYGRHLPKQKSENKIKLQDIPAFMTETINKKWNYDNTKDMAVSSAKKNIRLKNNYSFKRQQIKDLFEYNIPSIEDYDNIIKNKLQKIKERRYNLNKEIHKYQKINFLSRKQLINFQIDKNIELLNEKEKEYNK